MLKNTVYNSLKILNISKSMIYQFSSSSSNNNKNNKSLKSKVMNSSSSNSNINSNNSINNNNNNTKQIQLNNSNNINKTGNSNSKHNSLQKTSSSSSKQYKPILSQQQRSKLMLQQKLTHTYTQLESLPSDSYDTVIQNYRRIKTKLMDRRVYIPNKPQIMLKMDNNLQFIKQHHTVWRAPSTANDRLISDTKKEIIQWELEEAKKQYYLSLLQNQKFLSTVAFTFVGFITFLEYFWFVKQQDNARKAPKMFL